MTDKTISEQLSELEEINHIMTCVYGKYKCSDCDYTSMNNVSAKAHTLEENNIEYESIHELF